MKEIQEIKECKEMKECKEIGEIKEMEEVKSIKRIRARISAMRFIRAINKLLDAVQQDTELSINAHIIHQDFINRITTEYKSRDNSITFLEETKYCLDKYITNLDLYRGNKLQEIRCAVALELYIIYCKYC